MDRNLIKKFWKLCNEERLFHRVFCIGKRNSSRRPSFSLFFILALEVMFIEVRRNVNIAGVKIGTHSVKLSAYADDTFFFTLDINSLWLIVNTCDKFEEYSSLKRSVKKCQACCIGSAKGRQDAPINCNWVNLVEGELLVLGVHMSYDVTLAEKCNLFNLITSMKEILWIWGGRGLTPSWKNSDLQVNCCI